MFEDIIDSKVFEFVALKVSSLSGDIRVAFDYMKTAFSSFYQQVQSGTATDYKITVKQVLEIYEKKQNSKIGDILRSLPRQDITVLNAAVVIYADIGADRSAKLMDLFEETEMECDVRSLPKMELRQFLTCIDELEYYNLIQVDRRDKAKPASFMLSLNCNLQDLTKELASWKAVE